MTATYKRIDRGRYAFIWQETGQRIYAVKDDRRELLPIITGNAQDAQLTLHKFIRISDGRGIKLV